MCFDEVIDENIDISAAFQNPQKFKKEWLGETCTGGGENAYFALVEWEDGDFSIETANSFMALKEMSQNLEMMRGVKHYIPIVAKVSYNVKFIKLG